MRAVIQRVSEAKVWVAGEIVGQISVGLVVLIGIEDRDTIDDIQWLSKKIVQLRIFNDDAGLMNRDVKELDGDILAISQFTLHAATKKGNRPSYIKASKPEFAEPMYEKILLQLQQDMEKPVQRGIFGADMKVSLVNDGPVTIMIDTQNKE